MWYTICMKIKILFPIIVLVTAFVVGCNGKPTETPSFIPTPTMSPLETPAANRLENTTEYAIKEESQMDFETATIGGVTLFLLILGLVEAAKQFGITGKGSLVLSIVLGAFFLGLFKALEAQLVPAVAIPWIEVVVYGLGGGLAVSGLYDLAKRLSTR